LNIFSVLDYKNTIAKTFLNIIFIITSAKKYHDYWQLTSMDHYSLCWCCYLYECCCGL